MTGSVGGPGTAKTAASRATDYPEINGASAFVATGLLWQSIVCSASSLERNMSSLCSYSCQVA